jgi:hypothetical protein
VVTTQDAIEPADAEDSGDAAPGDVTTDDQVAEDRAEVRESS